MIPVFRDIGQPHPACLTSLQDAIRESMMRTAPKSTAFVTRSGPNLARFPHALAERSWSLTFCGCVQTDGRTHASPMLSAFRLGW